MHAFNITRGYAPITNRLNIYLYAEGTERFSVLLIGLLWCQRIFYDDSSLKSSMCEFERVRDDTCKGHSNVQVRV